ncbi:MAG: hypothetical protein ACYSWX_05165 [Planctomycetota bacterium]|jgi:hypothetical protein
MLLCALLGACDLPAFGVPVPSVYLEDDGEPEPGPIAPADLALLDELRRAWEVRELTLARRLVGLLEGRSEDPRVLQAADDYRRRIEGFELLTELDLRLIAETDPDDPARTRLTLGVKSASSVACEVHLLTPTVQRRLISLSPLGLESLAREDHLLEGFEPLRVVGGSEALRVLGSYRRPSAGALASRENYALDPAGSWLTVDGELLPVDAIAISSASRTGVAAFLPAQAVDPEELVEYLSDPRVGDIPDDILLPALLERAVRVHPSRRVEAVGLIADAVEGWDDSLVTRAAPAFRWLSEAYEAGGDPFAWRVYFAGVRARRSPDAEAEEVIRPRLLIPGRDE